MERALPLLARHESATKLLDCGIEEAETGNLWAAIVQYRHSIEIDPTGKAYFHLGAAFADPRVSQPLDAFDCFRIAERYGLTTRGATAPVIAQLEQLAKKVPESDSAFYSMPANPYISPFVLFQLEHELTSDTKAIQKAKKLVLHELELNDGKISWMSDYPLTKSDVLRLEESLHDPSMHEYHRLIRSDDKLYHFLLSGKLALFRETSSDHLLRAIKTFLEDVEFQKFISPLFAKQLNAVIRATVKARNAPLLQLVLSGRRLVHPKHDEYALSPLLKHATEASSAARELLHQEDDPRPRLLELDRFFNEFGLSVIASIPAVYVAVRTTLITEIRSLAIRCENQYDDHDAALKLLALCESLVDDKGELHNQVRSDIETVQENQAFSQRSAASAVKEKKASHSKTSNGLGSIGGFLLMVFLLSGVQTALKSCDSPSTYPKSTIQADPPASPATPVFNNEPSVADEPEKASTPPPTALQLELESQKAAIEQLEVEYEQTRVWVKSIKQQLDSQRWNEDDYSQSERDLYNEQVKVYNQTIANGKQQHAQLNAMIDEYNELLKSRAPTEESFSQ